MRFLVVVGSALLAAGCESFPVMADPRLDVSPYMAVYRLRGDVGMQSNPGTGPVDNPSQSVRNFGIGDYESTYGVRADLGDGFGGFLAEYYRFSANTTRTGTLSANFGTLLAGEQASMSAAMDEWRFGWLQPVWRDKVDVKDSQLEMRLALGGIYAHRDLEMRFQNADASHRESISMRGDVVYPAARFRAGWRSVMFELEYAISPSLALGGDFGDLQQDFEARFAYTVPFQDVTMFAGYRYSTLQGDGHEAGLGFDADLTLDGFQFGVEVTF